MISVDNANMKSDLSTIDDLVEVFFKSADRNHDNAISQEEFVTGVSEMPVILHLLQCDPGAGVDMDGPIAKLDSLDIDKDQKPLKSEQVAAKNGKAGDARGATRSRTYKTS